MFTTSILRQGLRPSVKLFQAMTIPKQTSFIFTRGMSKRFLGHLSGVRSFSQNVDSADPIVFNDEFRLIYEGPLSKKIKLVKILSLSTACMSICAGPALVLMGRSSISMFGKLFLASTIVTMGVTTTLLLHWLTRVYVYKMYFHPHTRTFAAETSTLFGTVKRKTFSLDDIIVPEIESVFSTFEARGNKFFIHMDMKEAEQILKYVRESNLESL